MEECAARAATVGSFSCDTAERCDGQTPVCPPDYAPAVQGTACDDRDSCTERDACTEGRRSGTRVCSVDITHLGTVVKKGHNLEV